MPSTPAAAEAQPISADVVAVMVALIEGEPCVLTVQGAPRLPSGPLLQGHRSLQVAVRAWVEEQTGRELGYLEQLYTFTGQDAWGRRRHLSVSYLGLTSGADRRDGWVRWYDLFPWEDTRGDDLVSSVVAPRLASWVAGDATRAARAASLFGLHGRPWEPDLVLQRYELLYEAGLVPESPDAGRREDLLVPGTPLESHHRRIVATGVARLRAKIQYRPVVFELMPDTFTLGQLQACVEALAGRTVHTQNFRRLVAQQELVEETGEVTSTGGRPARLFRFRRDVLLQRTVAGTKLPTTRAR